MATFSAPCILIDFMSERILLNLEFVTFFSIGREVDKTLKRYVCILLGERGDVVMELLEYRRFVESFNGEEK